MNTTNEIMDLADNLRWASYQELNETRADLLKAVEALVDDAARYRAIRDQIKVDPNNSLLAIGLMNRFGIYTLHGSDADAAIDAAMKGAQA